ELHRIDANDPARVAAAGSRLAVRAGGTTGMGPSRHAREFSCAALVEQEMMRISVATRRRRSTPALRYNQLLFMRSDELLPPPRFLLLQQARPIRTVLRRLGRP